MTQPLKALIVEDNANNAELLTLLLEQGSFKVESARVDTAEDYEAALGKQPWDVIFGDHSMPHFNSFQALSIRKENNLDTPFIILSGTMGEDMAVEAMKAGASDYFVECKLRRLVAAINRELQETREREVRKKTELELAHFVATLTHDLRTPVLGGLRVLELLDKGNWGDLNPEQKEVVHELSQATRLGALPVCSKPPG